MTAKKFRFSEAGWEKAAGQVARLHVGEMYACRKCNYPVIDGYVCSGCGANSPRTTEAEDKVWNAKYAR